jgi:two-component system, OmpR family, aerobic respiration control protein ArcA
MKGGELLARILVIDDDPGMERVVAQSLGPAFDVRSIGSAVELPDILRLFEPDLIVLDIGLPWVNGFELCDDIRKVFGPRHIPILFLSGLNSDDDRRRSLDAGGDRYLSKPFDVIQFREVIHALLKVHSGASNAIPSLPRGDLKEIR